MLLAVCVFAPLWEEVVFRGILNAKIFKKRFVGVLISSILFAVLHGYVSPAMLFYFCLGIAFSLVNRDQTDVFTSVVAHMSFNVIVLILTLSS
ncbi:CPBP family intramembrane glutamic endopeptidase [Lacticaseibacillus paracasei]